jgi:hypothetical protein
VIKSGLDGNERVVVSAIQRAIPGNSVKPVEVPASSSAAAANSPAAGKDKP